MILGFFIFGIGAITGYGNLRGWFLHPERKEFMKWVLESDTGMPIEHLPARAFMQHFPPPGDAQTEELIHVTKNVMRLQNGGVYGAQINYMHRDHSRTDYVTTLPEIRAWAAETMYPWLAWGLTLAGGLLMFATQVLDFKSPVRE